MPSLVALIMLLVFATITTASIEHLFSPGELVQKHAKHEDACKKCHRHFEQTSQRSLCLACHKKVAADISRKSGFHGRSPDAGKTECKHCHTDHKGRNFDIIRLDKDMFDHRLTDFPLKGSHRNLNCSRCHVLKTKYRDTPSKCPECHKKRDRHYGRLGKNCGNCHLESNWSKARFDHSKTKFPLKGRHKKVGCPGCHPETRYKKTPSACYACHRLHDVHGGGYTKLCETCHRPDDWKKAVFQHRGKVGHLEISDCYACHKLQDVHNGRYSKMCKNCHSTEKWKKPGFDHQKTKQIGRIKISDCYACHQPNDIHGGQYTRLCDKCHHTKSWKKSIFKHRKKVGHLEISDCYVCHKLQDMHKGRYGKLCKKCHGTEKWKKTIFDHEKTKFPLKGRHRKTDCDSCHPGNLYRDKLVITCYACHKGKDEHKGRYGRKCDKCHDCRQWKKIMFDHDKSGFPLREKHRKINCDTCHRGEKLKAACYGCHQFNDVHKGAYGRDCGPCHAAREWKRSRFDHDTTVFPGKDKISLTDCGKCYRERLRRGCYGCHQKNDIHKSKQGKLCNRCHNIKSWKKKILFDHDITNFPLIGLHAAASCEECHLEAAYTGTPISCSSCHKSKDKHQRRLGDKCGACHNPNSWSFWRFEHSSFALDGAHKGLECRSCHRKPVKGKIKLSKSCYSCHKKDSVHSGIFWSNCQRCHITKSFKEIKNLH
ncbi:MAG: hypothetical protein ACE5GM_06100 [bacterium]